MLSIEMLDIKLFREEPGTIRKDLEKRGWSDEQASVVDRVIELDGMWRGIQQRADDLKHQRNTVAKEISEMKRAKEDASERIAMMKDINAQIAQLDIDLEKAKVDRDQLLLTIPNLMDESVPIGKDDSDNVPIKHWGEPGEYDFELKSHQELITGLDLGNFEQPRATSGSGFYYLYDGMVLLDLALQRYALDHLMKKGFRVIEPPMMLNRYAMQGAVDLADFENVLYKVEGDDLYLIATSEHPMLSLHLGQMLVEKDLPLRYCGVSACFRREIGAHGLDTRGLFRSHQFNKIEQFIFSTPEQSPAEHELMLENAEELFQGLGLPYRVANICTGDLGGTAAKKYDIEVWMAKQGEYKEVVSCSNCTSYQARKLNIRYVRRDGTREVLHTLNSTAIATSRAMVAILEDNQQRDGTVVIPKVLRPYMNGMELLGTKGERT